MKLSRHSPYSPTTQNVSGYPSRFAHMRRKVSKHAEQALESVSLFSWFPFLYQDCFRVTIDVLDMYSLFNFKLLHSSSPGISKMLKECLSILISFTPAAAGRRLSALHACSILLTAIRRDTSNFGRVIRFLKKVHCTSNVIRGMLEEKEFSQPDSAFSSRAALVGSAMGEQHSHVMTHNPTMFSKIRHLLGR